jgi:hypothetical protein
LELFSILDPPLSFPNGVWAEALRLLVLRVGLAGVNTRQEVVRRITRHCHSSHRLRYDTSGTRTSYGVNDSGGTFNLSAFLLAAHPDVSCFDLLAGVFVLSGAVGVPVAWLTLDSFGYILETDLAGIGGCNNPLFTKNNTPKIICRRNRDRTQFGIHGFGELRRIFDACVGPHLGEDVRQDFLNAAVDDMNHENKPVPSADFITPEATPIKGLV